MLDDDEFILRTFERQLVRRRYSCASFLDSTSLLASLEIGLAPDLVILDYFLADEKRTGLDVCREIKSRFRVPVFMMSANANTKVIVKCLNAGADQYVVKPCQIEELVARMEASLRLYGDVEVNNWEAECLPYGIKFSRAERRLTGRDGSAVRLTEKEFVLFELFIAAGSNHLERTRAFMAIYGTELDPFNRSIDVLVSRLRRKLIFIDRNINITNVRSRGYMLVLSESECNNE